MTYYLSRDVFNVSLKQANLVTKTDFDNTVRGLNSEIAENKTKNKSIENELKRLKKNLGFIILGNIFFDGGDGSQAYLIFQPIHKYVKIIINTKYLSEWESKGLSDESI